MNQNQMTEKQALDVFGELIIKTMSEGLFKNLQTLDVCRTAHTVLHKKIFPGQEAIIKDVANDRNGKQRGKRRGA